MKKSIITMAFVLLAIAAQAQIKMHGNGRITFQTLSNSTGQGVVFGPAPDWNADFNGNVYFHKNVCFIHNEGAFSWMSSAIVNHQYSVCWVVSPNWTTFNFFVYGNGDAYSKHYYTITGQSLNGGSKNEGQEPIKGSEALEAISGLKGYYYAPEEQEIPDLENNEFVDPDAVDAMYADFEKRSVGLSGTSFLEAFPEGVRTDPQNRLCIDYQSVVTMLVEAVKEQQREIEELRKTLEENGLVRKQR